MRAASRRPLRLVGLALTLMLCAGCNFFWKGGASVTLQSGAVHRCVHIDTDHFTLTCRTSESATVIPWRLVAGIRTDGAR